MPQGLKVRASLSRLLRTAAQFVVLAPLAGPAHAQQPESAPADTQTDASSRQESQQDIVVVAERSEQSSIDRTTYVVKDNAEARASNALDLLGRVPAVDVSPSGQVRLIGRSGVTIQVDGQEVPNGNAFLRAMQGSQVAKIEVVTNPSAQFSARGTGGIINIVTRRSSAAGLGGSVTGSLESFGAYDTKVSPSWSRGKVSLNGALGVSRWVSRLGQREEWDVPGTGADIDRLEEGRMRNRSDALSADLRATVELAPKQSLSVNGQVMNFDGKASSRFDIIEGGGRAERRSSGTFDSNLQRISADYRREGGRQGEQTTVSASHMSIASGSRNDHRTKAGPDESTIFSVRSDQVRSSTSLKFDHVRPAGERRLSAGGQYEHSFEDNRQQSMIEPPAGAIVFMDTSLEGSWSEGAAYFTYQFPAWGNVVMAGTRLESRGYDIAGVAEDPVGGTNLFPSLHVERKLERWLTANVSYSSRISWPGITDLDPRLRFSDPTSATAGNPLLRPEKTHSLELKLLAKAGNHSADLTAHYQRTRDLRSHVTELEGEVLVSRPVNVGTRTSRGANLQLRGPLAKGLKYVASAYLARETIGEIELTGIDDASTSYGGLLQLEYRDGTEGRAGADHIRLGTSYSGPTETGLARFSSTVRANASWSHALTDRLSTVMTLSHWLRSATSTVFGGDVVSRQETRFRGPTVKVALTYSLARGAQ
jgi:outer membrane receptor protein involved in Fe transport